ncbi:hypothetical protein [Fimbriiglobus ruber]|uniref:Uncharacterized protein n=1 Tax=Fimbriiglobus ruber TaxID=1908690 RepID=A0A225DHI0_9BACT|nr:hypothetical protein [Fimbriiglobus ruber]OWK35547.1 hypothetical protein FRUB_08110 [Fimbriiglobus ruber]
MLILLPTGTGGEGEPRRGAALTLLSDHRADLIRECTAVAIRIALEQGEVCAVVPIPVDIPSKLVGCVGRELADAGILRRDGYRNSTRPAAHARPLSVWRLADASAAIDRLAALRTTR